MNYHEPTPAQVFTERIHLYQELSNQVVARLVGNEDAPDYFRDSLSLAPTLSEEALHRMSDTDYFRYETDGLSRDLSDASDEEIDIDQARAESSFEEFKKIFTTLHPDHALTSAINSEQPVTAIVEGDSIGQLLDMISDTALFDAKSVFIALKVLYLNESGALARIKSVPQLQRQKMAYDRVDRILKSPSFLSSLVDDYVFDHILYDMVKEGQVDERHPFDHVDIRRPDEERGRPSLHVVYKAIDSNNEEHGISFRAMPRQQIYVESGRMLVRKSARIAAVYLLNKSLLEEINEEPEQATQLQTYFALNCLLRAIGRINGLSELTDKRLRLAIGV